MVWLLPSEMKGAGAGDRSNGDRTGRKMEWVCFTGRLHLPRVLAWEMATEVSERLGGRQPR